MATPATTVTQPKAVDRGVAKAFVDGYQQINPQHDKVFNVMSQEDYNEEHAVWSGLGSFSFIAEGDTYPEITPQQQYTTNFQSEKHGGIYPFTIELDQWTKPQIRKLINGANLLGKTAARRTEELAASVLNNGFNTSFTSYGDNKPLFSTDHTSSGGFTAQSNASATSVAFSEDAVETLQILLETQLDDNNQPLGLFGDCLVVPPSLIKEGLIVARSEGRSGTADNDANINNSSIVEYKGRNIDKVLGWQYLRSGLSGSNTAWFIMDSSQHRLMWLWGEKPTVKRSEEAGFRNDQVIYKGRMQCSYGWDDWRGVVGSKGDGTAYSS